LEKIIMLYNTLSIITLIFSFILGIYVYENNKTHKVNRTFIFLIVSAILWIFVNYTIDTSVSIKMIRLWSELALIGPIFIAYFFYKLSIIFPKEKPRQTKIEFIIKLVMLVLVGLSFTSLNISNVYFLDNNIPAIDPGPLYIFFLIYFVTVIILSLCNLFRKYKTFNKLEKLQVQYISLGLGLSALSGTVINGILPILGYSEYINLGPYFILIFIFFTSYAIIKFKMFDIKIISTELLVLTIWIFVIIRILVANTLEDKLVNGGLLFLLLIFGTFLIRSVIKEVESREKIQLLATDLQKANDRLKELDKQKTEFVSFATHQLRAPLTAMKGYASLIIEGDLGVLSKPIRDAITRIYDSSNTLTNIVDDYLNISRIELGTMKYLFDKVDLRELVDNVVGELKPNIEKSGLNFSTSFDQNKKYLVHADKDKFKQIVANLIDNSIKYTKSGSVVVSLNKKIEGETSKIIFSVKDTGIGIDPEVMPKLFTKFSRAENGNRQNIHGTGLGLYVAKQIVMAHGGKIWAESAGEGKGSTFFVELEEGI